MPITPLIDLNEDMHVHSLWSDGKDTLETNIAAATARGLRRLGCVDHVRQDTAWVDPFRRAVWRLAERASCEVLAGVEAKILNQGGALDLPPGMPQVDFVLAADHRFPIGSGSWVPRRVRQCLAVGALAPSDVVDCLVASVIATMERFRRPEQLVIAHLFSILPRVGLGETDVPDRDLQALARVAANTGTIVEVDERWGCPGLRAVEVFAAAGVPVWCSSDAHCADKVGVYVVNARLAAALNRVRAAA